MLRDGMEKEGMEKEEENVLFSFCDLHCTYFYAA